MSVVIHTCISPNDNDGRSLRCSCKEINKSLHKDQVGLLVAQGLLVWTNVKCGGSKKEIYSEAVVAIGDADRYQARVRDRAASHASISATDIQNAYTENLEGNYHQKRIEIFDELTSGIFVDLGASARRRRS